MLLSIVETASSLSESVSTASCNQTSFGLVMKTSLSACAPKYLLAVLNCSLELNFAR